MIAQALGITVDAWRKWFKSHSRPRPDAVRRRGRPTVMSGAVREAIRKCYLDHFGQWGPTVLRPWARRQGLGIYSVGTIDSAIADIKVKPDPKPRTLRCEVTASNILWAEDGASFRENGEKRELLVLQDEHARYRVNDRLVDGPATGKDVASYLEEAFIRHGAPLVIKHDGGSIFHDDDVRKLFDRYRVVELTGPRHHPQYNGKKERGFRDLRSFARAMHKQYPWMPLSERIKAAIKDLNDDRPRPVLSGCTAAEVYQRDRITLPDRAQFKKEVEQTRLTFLAQAASREERDSAGRRAVETVLSRYGYLEFRGTMSTDFRAAGRKE
ncbi:MAG: transposase [Deltaproteobacteria bacterium]|nr:transposase [Deltaproteobacteria bacterium]